VAAIADDISSRAIQFPVEPGTHRPERVSIGKSLVWRSWPGAPGRDYRASVGAVFALAWPWRGALAGGADKRPGRRGD
jgi:hypothetical protein